MNIKTRSSATLLRAGLVVLIALLVVACVGAPSRGATLLTSTAHVNLERYMGTWYVIGHVPYFGERGKVATRDVYILDEDGNVDTTYIYRESFEGPEKTMHSVGVVQPDTHNNYWVVHFWWLFRADYLILDVASDYSWVLIGQPGGKLGWIMARKPTMDDARYRELLHAFSEYGYDPARFKRVPQLASQLGKPGFE